MIEDVIRVTLRFVRQAAAPPTPTEEQMRRTKESLCEQLSRNTEGMWFFWITSLWDASVRLPITPDGKGKRRMRFPPNSASFSVLWLKEDEDHLETFPGENEQQIFHFLLTTVKEDQKIKTI